ncbi:hypothetical protein Tco_0194264, partial [Tanacetum coccineum]
MKIKESLNVTFDETPPASKTSPLVDDDLDEVEAIKVIEKKILENDIEDETLEIDKIVNIKESRNNPLENVMGNLNQRTLRSQAQNQTKFFCFISTIEPKNVNEALKDESSLEDIPSSKGTKFKCLESKSKIEEKKGPKLKKFQNDEPMCVADRVIAPTPGSAITIPETANEFAIKGSNSDTDKIMAQMDAMTMKMDAQYKEFISRSKPNPDHNDDDIPMYREEEARFMQTFRHTHFYNDYHYSNRDNWRSSGRNDYNRDNYQSHSDDKPDLQKQLSDFIKAQHSTNYFVKDTFMDLKNKLKTTTKNHQASIQNLEAKFYRFANKQSGRPSGSLPSNTQPNPKVRKTKNLLVEVGKFTFSVDFVILELEEDSKVPLILGRPFFTLPMYIDVIDEILEEDFDALLDEGSEIFHSINGTILEEKLFAEFDEFMAMTADENSESESDTEEPPFKK